MIYFNRKSYYIFYSFHVLMESLLDYFFATNVLNCKKCTELIQS